MSKVDESMWAETLLEEVRKAYGNSGRCAELVTIKVSLSGSVTLRIIEGRQVLEYKGSSVADALRSAMQDRPKPFVKQVDGTALAAGIWQALRNGSNIDELPGILDLVCPDCEGNLGGHYVGEHFEPYECELCGRVGGE